MSRPTSHEIAPQAALPPVEIGPLCQALQVPKSGDLRPAVLTGGTPCLGISREPRGLPPALTILLGLLAFLLAGCGGGQDFGGISRNLNGDIGSGYDTPLSGRYRSETGPQTGGLTRGTYPKIETSFQLPSIPGDPFDYEQVNVQVTLRKPDGGTVDVPAFFDGGTTWRMRYTPTAPGRYAVAAVKLNRTEAHEEKLEPKEWTVEGEPQPGFVRIDRGDHSRFVFDNGARYYPLGHNQAWHSDSLPEIPELFQKMHAAGENWSRVWMDHWDGKNLDWPASGKPAKLGDIDLQAAHKWDAIVEAAEKNGIYFQMTLQHHGQYSSQKGYRYSNNNNANWESNPYNVKNGGFLQAPEDFFTNPQARALTKRKLYYILARWGYSPSILAWELFNEVEGTDAGNGKLWQDIAMWHREMSLFLRQYDGYRHLITTSAYPGLALDNPVWETVDYIQQHAYPTDLITALGAANPLEGKKPDKPLFVGEFGPANLDDPEGLYLHQGLWASLMRGPSGAAQYWDWVTVEKHNLYGEFQAVRGFLTASGLANHGGLVSALPPVETSERATLRFGPGGGWEQAEQSEFVVGANGPPSGMSRYPAFLQGRAHRSMTPKPLTFQVSYPQPGTFTVTAARVARAGAHLRVAVDGKVAERDYPAGNADYTPEGSQAAVQVEVPAGAHTVTVENTGNDWVVIRDFALSGYASALAAQARIGKDFAAAWVYHRDNINVAPSKTSGLSAANGRLRLIGLQKGRYRATWWDTQAGKSLDAADVTVADAKEGVTLVTPSIVRDAALYVVKAGGPSSGSAERKRPRREKAAVSAAPAPPAVGTSVSRPVP